ncbi:INO80 complex subunit D [Sitophilus oryzae]|uniref:INO80 complex subunit D n=1 Tax=Sitophilus oryzae TaxID=7048 RepID=A0A6J2YJE6_SITOR|nr:INO80 complex subunit D [Sitophilus oryzae]
MFNSGIKGNQRCNGLYSSPHDISVASSVVNTKNYNNSSFKNFRIENKDVFNNKRYVDPPRKTIHNNKSFNGNRQADTVTTLKEEPDFDEKPSVHSIIGISNAELHKSFLGVEDKIKKENLKVTHHEALQRIEYEKDEFNYYQQHWFSVSLEKFKMEDRSREERIEITRHEFLRQLQQIQRSNVGKKNKMPEWKEQPSRKNPWRSKTKEGAFVAPRLCEVENCGKIALACTRHCIVHIMLDTKQVLFEYCTAKFADSSQCSVPVFDVSHELPLCAEHARKRDNYGLYHEAKPKKIRKRVKPSAMIRPQKRNKKKKKPLSKASEDTVTAVVPSAIIREIAMPSGEAVQSSASPPPTAELEVEDLQIDQVLELNDNGLEQALVSQAHLLEESDISNVLSTIQVDEFSDFFSVNRNGEYEPSREEEEELEKALAAVDNDVKSLEKLSQSHGLLDSLLDEHVLTDSLVQIPEMFHNGYSVCGDNIVAQSGSFLLPVEPHSNS